MRIKDLDRNGIIELEMRISKMIQIREIQQRAENDLLYCRGEIDRNTAAIESLFNQNTNKGVTQES